MDKEKRQKRIQQKANHVNRQVGLAKLGLSATPVGTGKPRDIEQPHRLQKRKAWNCGNPNCIHCANPRKIFGELTLQEQKHQEVCAEYSDRVVARERDIEE